MTNSYIIRVKEDRLPMVVEWLRGISYGLKAVDSAIEFDVIPYPPDRVLIRTNSIPLWGSVITTLEHDGYIQRNFSPED